jgi:hypothetical protein
MKAGAVTERGQPLQGKILEAMGEMPAVFHPLPAVQQRIQRELQQQFDPHGVFNTGRGG